jgi:hypothetical protein
MTPARQAGSPTCTAKPGAIRWPAPPAPDARYEALFAVVLSTERRLEPRWHGMS